MGGAYETGEANYNLVAQRNSGDYAKFSFDILKSVTRCSRKCDKPEQMKAHIIGYLQTFT